MAIRSWIGVLAALGVSTAGHANLASDPLEPRDFGLFIGDVVTQTVHLELAPGRALVPASLPTSGRTGPWFERQSVNATPETGGWRIELRYQVVNAPASASRVTLPGFRLTTQASGQSFEETQSDAEISLSPLAADGNENLRPDRSPPHIDTTPIRDRLVYCGLALLALGLPWLGSFIADLRRSGRQRPFAAAYGKIRRLGKAADGAAAQDALRLLHGAFNATTGRTVFADALPAFFAAHAHFTAARPAIEGFFALSARTFFESETGDRPAVGNLADLRALARQLKRLEARRG